MTISAIFIMLVFVLYISCPVYIYYKLEQKRKECEYFLERDIERMHSEYNEKNRHDKPYYEQYGTTINMNDLMAKVNKDIKNGL